MKKIPDVVATAGMVVMLLAVLVGYIAGILAAILAISETTWSMSVQVPVAFVTFMGGMAAMFLVPLGLMKVWSRRREKVASPRVVAQVFDAFAKYHRSASVRTSSIILGACALHVVCIAHFQRRQSLVAVLISLSSVALLHVRHTLLRYRMDSGFFGANAYEARAVIQFILRHDDRFDFSGGLGAHDLAYEPAPDLFLSPAEPSATRVRDNEVGA